MKSLKQKLDIQHVMITDKDNKAIQELQDGITEAELGNVELSQINDKMKGKVQHEIEELKEIRTEINSQDLDGQDFQEESGILKQELKLKGNT